MAASVTPGRRWLQFSLRTAFVALTVGCVWLGWATERAKKRGKAIDAILSAGGSVGYGDRGEDLYIGPYAEVPNHFWLDLQGVPLMIRIDHGHFETFGPHLSDVYGIERLIIQRRAADDEMRFLYGIQGRLEILFSIFCKPSDLALKKLQQKLPEAKLVWEREDDGGVSVLSSDTQ